MPVVVEIGAQVIGQALINKIFGSLSEYTRS
jgi:hypothetical protein